MINQLSLNKMKKTFLITVLMIAFINANCQQATPAKTLTGGDELIIAQKSSIYGGVLIAFGVGCIVDGEVDYYNQPKSFQSTAIGEEVFGGCLMIVGIIFENKAFNHLEKAKILFNKKELSFNVSPIGVGLCLKF